MRRLPYRSVKWKINLPEAIAAQVELALANISGTGPQYGQRSTLIATLLKDWLDSDRDRGGAAEKVGG